MVRESAHVDEVIEYSHRRGIGGLMNAARMIRRLRRRYFHVAVLLSGSSRPALWAALAGIPLRVGAKGQSGSWLLTHRDAAHASDPAGNDRYTAIAATLARAP
jgi:ADP-heptose:LPS heptosyltransferase